MKRFRLIFVITSIMLSGILQAQSTINSPYSRYGLGELHGKNVNTQLQGMGGISIGMGDATMINPGNPASYGLLDTTAITIEAGIVANIVNLQTDQFSENSQSVTISYLLVGFPINKWWKSSFGIMPYSKIGYNIDLIIDMSEYNFADILNEVEGEGGINRVYWGNSFNIGKNLRLGIDASYIFGNSNRNSTVLFLDSLNIYGSKVETSTRGSGFIFDYGLQYDIHTKGNDVLTLGVIYANSFNVSANRKYLSKTITGGYYDVVEEVQDTVQYIPDEKGSFVIPARLGFGAVYKRPGSWLVGMDVEWQKWSDFERFGVPDTLNNTLRLAMGGQFSPDHTSISSLFKRMTYRAGARFQQSYLSFNGNPINEFGISFGVSFPMKKSKTAIDLSFEVGQRGTTKDNLIQENFFNINFGLSIQEHWFYKRKYN